MNRESQGFRAPRVEWRRRAAVAFAGLVVLAALFAVAITTCGEDKRHQRLAVLDVASGKSRIVSADDRTVDTAQWMPDSEHVLVLEGETPGGYFLSLRDARTGDMVWELEGAMEADRPLAAAPSPDGDEVAVLRDSFGAGNRSGRIHFVDAATGQVKRETAPWVTQLTAGATPLAADVEWMSRSRLAVVSHHGAGFNDLLRLDASAGGAFEWTTTEPSEVWALADAGSGRLVVYAIGQPGPPQLVLYYENEATGHAIPTPISGNFFASFSPDGQKLAVASGERVYIFSFANWSAVEVAQARTQGISWGSNGRIALAWGKEVFSMAEDGSDRRTLAKVGGGKTVRGPVWSPDGTKLAYVVEPKYRD